MHIQKLKRVQLSDVCSNNVSAAINIIEQGLKKY